MLPTKESLQSQRYTQTENEGMEKMQTITKRKQGQLCLLDKVDFRTKIEIRDKKEHYVMIKQ